MPEDAAHIGGPNICGDSIDIRSGEILTGSWRPNDQLEIWDMRSLGLMSQTNFSKEDKCQVYGAKFALSSEFLVAGGSDCTSIRIFDLELTPKERLGYFDAPVTSVAAKSDGTIVFAASQNGKCFAFTESE